MALDSSEAELDSLLAQLNDGDGMEAEVVDDLPDEDEWRSSKRLSKALSIKIDDDFNLDDLDLGGDKSSSSSSSDEGDSLGAPSLSEPEPYAISAAPSVSLDSLEADLDKLDVDAPPPRSSYKAPSPRSSYKEPPRDSYRSAPAPRDSYSSGSRSSHSAGCSRCGGDLVGDALQACHKLWHPSCFTCRDCNIELGTREFYEHEDGTPYCMGCAKRRFLPQCDACRSPIEGKMLKALGKQFHERCFTCAVCRNSFPDGSFWEQDGVAYCKTHYYDKFGVRCGGCSGVITSDKALKALGQLWHKEHFVCTQCGVPFPDGQFYEKDGRPYCKEHYHAASGTNCAKCGSGISGTMIKALGKTWHNTCFVCTNCRNPLSGSVMMVKKSGAEEPWCQGCYNSTYK